MSSRERTANVLVVDDEQDMVDYLVEVLRGRGFAAHGYTSPKRALERLESSASCDVMLADIEMAEMRGLDLLAHIRSVRPTQLVILMTGFGTIDIAVDAVRRGASDFLPKPFTDDGLVMAIERVLEAREIRREIVRLRSALPSTPSAGIVAKSAAMQRVMEVCRKAADTRFPVLLTGESGTGKTRLARFIHEVSERKGGPFVPLNCAALPHTLIESELFGVRKGAFTDARETRPGVFLEAHGGTLFLDEIAEVPLDAQAKLLRAIEAGQIRAVGAVAETSVDARILAATNHPLEESLRAQRFRPDLYFRLNVIRVEVPPLRERIEDIPELVDVLLERSAANVDKPIVGVSADALRWILSRPWPGNVRELANALDRACAFAQHDTILVEDLEEPASSVTEADFMTRGVNERLPLAEVELEYMRRIVSATGGNMSEAARVLGIDRRTLYRRLHEKAR